MGGVFARDGLELARSTICGWHMELAKLIRPLVAAIAEVTPENDVIHVGAPRNGSYPMGG